jgi:hypothetical protein
MSMFYCRQGSKLVSGKFENDVKAGHLKDTFGCGGDIA